MARSSRLRRVAATTASLGVVVAAALTVTTTASADPVFPPYEEAEQPPEVDRSIGHFHLLPSPRVAAALTVDARPRRVPVAGRAGVPPAATSVLMAVTASSPRKGEVTVWAPGTARPRQPSVSVPGGGTATNSVAVALSDRGDVAVASAAGSGRVRLTVVGWTERSLAARTPAAALALRPVDPVVVHDTRRPGTGRLGAGRMRTIRVTGRGTVPRTARAVAVSVAAWRPTRAGQVTVFRAGGNRPTSPTLSLSGRRSSSTTTVVPVRHGRIAVWNKAGSTGLTIAVTGWYGRAANGGSGVFGGEKQQHLADTRLARGSSRGIRVAGRMGVPDDASAALVQVTASARSSGHLTLWSAGARRQRSVPSVVVAAGTTVTGSVLVRLSAAGKLRLSSAVAGPARVRVSLLGWVSSGGLASPGGPAPRVERVVVAGSPAASAALRRVTPAGAVPLRSGGTRADLETMKRLVRAGYLESAPAPPADPGLLGTVPSERRVRTAVGTPAARRASACQAPASNACPNFPIWSADYLQAAPATAVGRIYSFRQGQLSGTCTGTVIARGYVLTAAHCVNHESFTFYPGQYGSLASSSPWFSTEAYVPTAYSRVGSAADYAVIVFRPAGNSGRWIGDATATYDVLLNSPGGTKWSFGYPSEGNFSGRCNGGTCYPYSCYSPVGDFQLWATDASVSYGGWWTVGFGCFMTGGASGGPVFEVHNGRYYVSSVNSYLGNPAGTYGVDRGCARPSGVCFTYAHNMWGPFLSGQFNEFLAAVPR